jgi:CMP/dCMP kinase
MPEPKVGFVIAIDGPAGAGKSTLAGGLARALGIPYLNTGAMYRSLAAEALRARVDPADGGALAELARSLRFSLAGNPPSLLVDARSPGEHLAAPDVEAVVSSVASHPEVRAVLRAEQRRLGAAGAVVEGRDIGTVVFPDADVKVFLVAEPDERVARRQAARSEEDQALAAALERRDSLDARTNPLVPAADATVVDSTGRSPDEVLAEVMALVGREGA